MLRFILQTVIMIALAAIVYLMAETLPRISDEEVADMKARRSTRLMGYVEKSDAALKSFSERFLRRVKVWLLQLNNFIEAKLGKLRKESGRMPTLPETEEKKES